MVAIVVLLSSDRRKNIVDRLAVIIPARIAAVSRLRADVSAIDGHLR